MRVPFGDATNVAPAAAPRAGVATLGKVAAAPAEARPAAAPESPVREAAMPHKVLVSEKGGTGARQGAGGDDGKSRGLAHAVRARYRATQEKEKKASLSLSLPPPGACLPPARDPARPRPGAHPRRPGGPGGRGSVCGLPPGRRGHGPGRPAGPAPPSTSPTSPASDTLLRCWVIYPNS